MKLKSTGPIFSRVVCKGVSEQSLDVGHVREARGGGAGPARTGLGPGTPPVSRARHGHSGARRPPGRRTKYPDWCRARGLPRFERTNEMVEEARDRRLLAGAARRLDRHAVVVQAGGPKRPIDEGHQPDAAATAGDSRSPARGACSSSVERTLAWRTTSATIRPSGACASASRRKA